MEFLVETLKNASLHINAVWLAIAYIAVILAMAVDFIAKLADKHYRLAAQRRCKPHDHCSRSAGAVTGPDGHCSGKQCPA